MGNYSLTLTHTHSLKYTAALMCDLSFVDFNEIRTPFVRDPSQLECLFRGNRSQHSHMFFRSDDDIPRLQRDFGVYIVNLFDTKHAAAVMGKIHYRCYCPMLLYAAVTHTE